MKDKKVVADPLTYARYRKLEEIYLPKDLRGKYKIARDKNGVDIILVKIIPPKH